MSENKTMDKSFKEDLEEDLEVDWEEQFVNSNFGFKRVVACLIFGPLFILCCIFLFRVLMRHFYGPLPGIEKFIEAMS